MLYNLLTSLSIKISTFIHLLSNILQYVAKLGISFKGGSTLLYHACCGVWGSDASYS